MVIDHLVTLNLESRSNEEEVGSENVFFFNTRIIMLTR